MGRIMDFIFLHYMGVISLIEPERGAVVLKRVKKQADSGLVPLSMCFKNRLPGFVLLRRPLQYFTIKLFSGAPLGGGTSLSLPDTEGYHSSFEVCVSNSNFNFFI